MDAPLGILVVTRGHVDFERNLSEDGALTSGEVCQYLQLPNDPALQWRLNVAAVRSVLQACFLAHSPEQQRRLANLGLVGLSLALAERDIDGVRGYSNRITTLLPDTSMEEINEAISNFYDSDAYRERDISSSDNEEMTYAETEDVDGLDGTDTEPSHGLKGLLYHIAETEAKRKAYEHRGIHCEECGERPIRGVRWHCLNCPDFDLCSTCEANTDHTKTHVFAKIKIPLPVLSQPTKEYPLWYPGDPRKSHSPLKPALKKRLQEENNFDGPQMDANYDQFTCIANVPWHNDPNEIKAAIDRRAFNRALTSERWPQRFRPNAVYDRMFAFYDTNSDGLIGFEEFVSGLAYLRGPKRYIPLRRALQGFDIDGDGYIDRSDFIRLFRAKHEIQKLIINDMVEGQETDQTRGAMETLRSSQPISAVFSMEEVPRGEDRPRNGKVMSPYGDMQPLPGTKTILEDDEGWKDVRAEEQRRRNRNDARRPPHERLQHRLSRFEEILSPTNGLDGQGEDTENETVDELARPQPNHVHGPRTSSNEHPSTTEPSSGADNEDEPLNSDILWQIVEDGFHEMLDPMFQAKEQQDQEVLDTRVERQTWRREITEAARRREEKKALQEELSNGAMIDPLMATAMVSNSAANLTTRRDPRPNTNVRTQAMVPTDAESLARREAEIAQLPLDELLNEIGYSRVDVDGTDGDRQALDELLSGEPNGTVLEHEGSITAEARPQGLSSEPQVSTYSVVSSSDLSQDPTMPQNRPNAIGMPQSTDGAKKWRTWSENQASQSTSRVIESKPPSSERLEHLSLLDEREDKLKARSGPGRLSYDEVEELVNADDSRELRGLVISWLEWASF